MRGERYAAALLAEAEAVREGIEAILGSEVMEDGIRLVVELDSKGLIQMLNKEDISRNLSP